MMTGGSKMKTRSGLCATSVLLGLAGAIFLWGAALQSSDNTVGVLQKLRETATLEGAWGTEYDDARGAEHIHHGRRLNEVNDPKVMKPDVPVVEISKRTGNTSKPAPSKSKLQREAMIQDEFQDFLFHNQFPSTPCKNRRVLLATLRPKEMDGFTVEIQDMARMFQVGLATDRTFFVQDHFKSAYSPSWCQNVTGNVTEYGRWTCMFNPITNCTEESVGIHTTEHGAKLYPFEHKPGDRISGYGIIKDEDDEEKSSYFDTYYYGGERIVDGDISMWSPQRKFRDVIPFWDRRMGRYWIRAQAVHFLWDKIGVADYLKNEIDLRLPSPVKDGKTPYIGMHIRFTDNINDLKRDFGRNANITRDVSNFLSIADGIRSETGINTIFVATDSTKVIDSFKEVDTGAGWTFLVQESVQRSEKNDFMWFKKSRGSMTPMIAADVEGLRRADYLIGSFQSNVYRLAAELNTAFHAGRYSFHQERHHTVDIEWYEDP